MNRKVLARTGIYEEMQYCGFTQDEIKELLLAWAEEPIGCDVEVPTDAELEKIEAETLGILRDDGSLVLTETCYVIRDPKSGKLQRTTERSTKNESLRKYGATPRLRCVVLDDDAGGQAYDAKRVIRLIDRLRLLNQQENNNRITNCAKLLDLIVERMRVRRFEPIVRSAKRAKSGSVKANRDRQDEGADRRENWWRVAEEVWEENPTNIELRNSLPETAKKVAERVRDTKYQAESRTIYEGLLRHQKTPI